MSPALTQMNYEMTVTFNCEVQRELHHDSSQRDHSHALIRSQEAEVQGWMVSCLRSCKEHEVKSGLELNRVLELKVYLWILMNTSPIPPLIGKGATWFLPLGKSSLPGER